MIPPKARHTPALLDSPFPSRSVGNIHSRFSHGPTVHAKGNRSPVPKGLTRFVAEPYNPKRFKRFIVELTLEETVPMRNWCLRSVTLALLVLFLAGPSLADAQLREVTLTDGRVFKGDTVEKEGLVTITTTEGRTFQFPKDQVKSVVQTTPPEVKLKAPGSPAQAQSTAAKSGEPGVTTPENPIVVLETSLGSITLELFEDDAPNTVANFVSLVDSGFYGGTLLHRVIKGFMMQGGDPNTKTTDESRWGMGGPGYNIDDECGSSPKWKNVRGAISMANAGPNTNGSQFFILFQDSSHLDGKHTVFGKVIEGMSVVDEIEKSVASEGDGKPQSKLELKKAVVKRKRNHTYQPVKNSNSR